MRVEAPALLPLFRSETQLNLLAALYRATDPRPVADLARELGSSLSTVSREVARLSDHELVKTEQRGRSKYVSARRDFSWAPALAEMLDRTVGVSAHLEQALGAVPGVEKAWVFGSWAERQHGRHGPPPRDVDVLVVGTPAAFDLRSATLEVEQTIGIAVDATVIERADLDAQSDNPVLAAILDSPLVELDIGDG